MFIKSLSQVTRCVNSLVEIQQRSLMLSGCLFGVPKKRRSADLRYKKKMNPVKLYPLLKGWHNYRVCDSCGGYYKKYHLCPTCYQQTRFETQKLREFLKEKDLKLSEEVVINYQDDIQQKIQNDLKMEIKVDRKRPNGWFSESLWKKF